MRKMRILQTGLAFGLANAVVWSMVSLSIGGTPSFADSVLGERYYLSNHGLTEVSAGRFWFSFAYSILTGVFVVASGVCGTLLSHQKDRMVARGEITTEEGGRILKVPLTIVFVFLVLASIHVCYLFLTE